MTLRTLCAFGTRPEAIKNDLMFWLKPLPLKTTSPGMGQAEMSWMMAGIFSSALPAVPWYLHSMPSRRRLSTCVSTTSM